MISLNYNCRDEKRSGRVNLPSKKGNRPLCGRFFCGDEVGRGHPTDTRSARRVRGRIREAGRDARRARDDPLPLYVTHVGAVQADPEGELLLRETLLYAQSPHKRPSLWASVFRAL